MSRLRIISNGAPAWLDQGPANGATGPAHIHGSLLVSEASQRDRDNASQRERKRRERAKLREEAA